MMPDTMTDVETFSGRRASQNKFELESFADLLVERGVTKYLEIGARHGDSFHYLMSRLPKGSTGVAVDLPGALWGIESSRPALKKAVGDLNGRGYKASAIFGDSQTAGTRRMIIGRGPYDAILIDGDHTLAGVTSDWQAYASLAPLVAFHDIVGTGQAEKVGGRLVEVPILWEQIRTRYRVVEFVAPESKMGIGCVLCDTT